MGDPTGGKNSSSRSDSKISNEKETGSEMIKSSLTDVRNCIKEASQQKLGPEHFETRKTFKRIGIASKSFQPSHYS